MAEKCKLVGVYTATTIAFVNSNPDTLTDSANGFLTAGIVAGATIAITGSTSNNITVTAATVVAGTITLVAGDTLTAEIAGDTVSLTITVEFSPAIDYPPPQAFDYGKVDLVSKLSGTRFSYSNYKKFIDEVTLNNATAYQADQFTAWNYYQISLTYTPNTDESSVTYTVKLANPEPPLRMRATTAWDAHYEGTLKIRQT